jgi:nitrite reductase/ring-hydroxylating ferredoxin subunit
MNRGASMSWYAAVSAEAVGEGEVVGVTLANQSIAICRVGGALYALDNVCTHQFALLSDGFVEDGCLECPLHQGRFDVKTGQPMAPPVTAPVRTYPVKIEDGRVLVEVA